jgi:hypothetical protein
MLIANQLMYDEKKTLILDRYTKTASSEDPKIEEDAVIDLIIDLVCFHRDLDSNDLNIRKSLEPEIRQKMSSFDPNNPELTHSAKLLRLLGGSNLGAMLTYAEDLDTDRRNEENKKQAARARTPRSRDALDERIYNWLTQDPSQSTPEIVERFRQIGRDGVIIDIDEETISYLPFPDDHPEKVKEIQISGMAARISRIKNRSR